MLYHITSKSFSDAFNKLQNKRAMMALYRVCPEFI